MNFQNSASIKNRLIVTIVMLSVMSVVFTGTFTYINARIALENATFNRLQVASTLKEESLKQWIAGQVTDIKWLFRMDPLIRSTALLSATDKTVSEREYANIHAAFDEIIGLKSDWQEVFLLNIEGKILVSTDRSHEGDYRTLDSFFVEGKKEMSVQKIYPSPITYGPTMTLSTPLLDKNNQLVGVLAMHMNLEKMDRILLKNTGLGRESESYLVDGFNVFISGDRFGRTGYLRGVHSEGINNAIKKKSGSGLYDNYQGEPVIGVYRWVDAIGAALMVEMPQSIAFAPARSLAINIFVVGFALAAILVFLVYSITTRITRPIEELTDKALEVSKGNLNVVVKKTSHDEIGILADTFNDMTRQLSKLYEDLSSSKEKAEAATRAKSIFLANMSHEIRTPMNSILGYTQVLSREKNISADMQDYLHRIEYAGSHLLELINTILDLSKIEAGAVTLNEEPFSLKSLIKEIADMFEIRCIEKRLQWQVQENYNTNATLRGDKMKIKQILINLINNAIKFTENGKVLLRVSTRDDNLYHFEVIDTGIGISADARQRIFVPFHQESNSDLSAGTGLGLSICQRQLDLMDSELLVESEPEMGSRFHFFVRLFEVRFDDAKAGNQLNLSTFRNAGLSVSAIVADDIADNRQIMSKLLTDLGIKVYQARNGLEVLELVERKAIDLIFMDIRMPVMDGIKTLKKLRSDRKNQHIKTIAISASSMNHQKESVLDEGFDLFIGKPFKFERVYDALSEFYDIQPKRESNSDKDDETNRDIDQLFAEFDLPPELIGDLKNSASLYQISNIEHAIEAIKKWLETNNYEQRKIEQLASILSECVKRLDMHKLAAYADKIGSSL